MYAYLCVCLCDDAVVLVGYFVLCCDLLHSCARFYKCNAPHYGTDPLPSYSTPATIMHMQSFEYFALEMCHSVRVYLCGI